MPDKQKIIQHFSKAYGTYEQAAEIQALSAQMMVERLPALLSHKPNRILEIGCGTGLLTRELMQSYPKAELILSDLSPTIIAQTAPKFCAQTALAMDGEAAPFLPQSFDLIAGNLVAQWFAAPHLSVPALYDLLRPGGMLFFTLLAEDTFIEWRKLLPRDRSAFDFPSLPKIENWVAGTGARIERVKMRRLFADGLDFLKHLHHLGAQHAQPDYIPLNVREMRAALTQLEQEKPVAITYDLVFLAAAKIGKGRADR